MKFKKAFTMAEAILVMTILGIIATIMITTLKPAQFKDKGLEIMARKVLSEIDTAITQIIISDTQGGSLEAMLNTTNDGSTYSFLDGNLNTTAKIFKKYLTATRQVVENAHCTSGGVSFYLKDGACIGIAQGTGSYATNFPGETAVVNITNSSTTKILGALYIDTNGDEEPNVIHKDRFTYPIGPEGIVYATE